MLPSLSILIFAISFKLLGKVLESIYFILEPDAIIGISDVNFGIIKLVNSESIVLLKYPLLLISSTTLFVNARYKPLPYSFNIFSDNVVFPPPATNLITSEFIFDFLYYMPLGYINFILNQFFCYFCLSILFSNINFIMLFMLF